MNRNILFVHILIRGFFCNFLIILSHIANIILSNIWVKSIQKNPKVSFVYRNENTKATYSFQGIARVSNSEIDRDIVYGRSAIAEQDHDFAKLGVVVLVDLEKIEGYSGLGPSGQLNQIKLIRRN